MDPAPEVSEPVNYEIRSINTMGIMLGISWALFISYIIWMRPKKQEIIIKYSKMSVSVKNCHYLDHQQYKL